MNTITIRGARQHNLKNIDVDIPRNQMVVITGLSGSGKSTFAFDTLYAEGQRRYVESLSAYARQFLERMEKPDVDLIEGLSPAIAIDQNTASHNPRSTVGTATEIYDYLRLLYSRIGTIHCHQCGTPITSQSVDQMVETIAGHDQGTKFLILAPVVRNQKASLATVINKLKKDGFARVRIDGEVLDIDAVGALSKNQSHSLDVVVDRLILKPGLRNRLADSLELALSISSGRVEILLLPMASGQPCKTLQFSETPVCSTCGVHSPELSPASFSFNSPRGACAECSGLGTNALFDPDLIVPNQELSLREGAIAPWANRTSLHFTEFIDGFAGSYQTDIYTPFKDLPETFRHALFFGSGDRQIPFPGGNASERTVSKPFEGLMAQLKRRYLETSSGPVRQELQNYMTMRPCPLCHGSRLRPESRSVKVNGLPIDELTRLSISKALSFFLKLAPEGQKGIIAEKITLKIVERLTFLRDVGLSYLTLDRAAHTLSGGESQRIRLATQIGAKLTGVLYVLDEPSIGLHPKDNQKLRHTLFKLRDLGNTVLVVEHDPETIMSADYVIDMGPGAGTKGGHVVFAGDPEMLSQCRKSITGRYLNGTRKIAIPPLRRCPKAGVLTVKGACHNNLKKIDVSFPLGRLICVTGLSGSGKSSLVIETLYKALNQHLYRSRVTSGQYTSIDGLELIDKVINVDQSPIGRTPRSNPATYTGAFNFIRELFSKTTESRMRGFKPGRFSFNVKGGRCESCKGDGIVKIGMQFLPDIYVPCDVCHGKCYNRETLEVRYKGKNIAEVLDMPVHQALAFFSRIGPVRERLKTLVDVGLGYIHLGQPATTLSGGEAQRVKLARELSKRSTGRTIYILDEPTTGLHMEDINNLLLVLNRLVDYGNTVIVIEHNLDVIKTADYIIDLGPEGGDAGGYIVATGTPEELAMEEHSYTGQFLRPLFTP
ncbi:MAG: excinuclease ABC subunit UvrA [Desulfobacteraceae bacterium]|jgi:excinuclease ABC subunit A